MTLPTSLHSVSQVRQLEAAAIAAGTPGYTLMTRAGAAAYELLRQRWPAARRLIVVAGPGNNGGDGLVLARLAKQDGLAATVMLLGASTSRTEASLALADARSAQVPEERFDAEALRSADVVVDALLGIGARAPLQPEWLTAIAAINACGKPVLALDIPSGLDADSGRALPAVRATATISFLALKQGLVLGDGPDHAGTLHFDALSLPEPELQPVLRMLDESTLSVALPPRARQSHKSEFGRVVIIGGGAGMPGAVRLAAEAALRVGAGLVTVASLPAHLEAVIGARPELMFRALHTAADVPAALADADVILIGPGLGRSDWAQQILCSVLGARRPEQRLVVDADALNIIAAGTGLQACEDWVLTPHPGEAARLLGISTEEIQRDRSRAINALFEKRGGTVVLKGAMTMVGQQGETTALCTRGNPGMSVPGMGDVLAGAIAGLLAQGASPFAASAAAVFAHAVAGDRCAQQGIRGVLALEVAHELRAVLAHLP